MLSRAAITDMLPTEEPRPSIFNNLFDVVILGVSEKDESVRIGLFRGNEAPAR